MKRGIVPADSNFDKHNQDQVDRLIEYRKATRGITPRGEEWLRDMLRFFLRQLHKPVEDVIPQDITRFLGRYMDKPYQRHCLYRALKSFYNWLKRGRSVSFNPMDEIDPPKLPKKLMNAVTAEQVPVLIKEARCTRDRAIISLLADSGVRRFELCNISVVDVDMDNSRIRVRGKGEKEGYLIFVSRAERNCTSRAEQNCTSERRGVGIKVSWSVRAWA